MNKYDRLFAHVSSITGLLSASQVQALFNAVESGELRDMATAAERMGYLPGDVAASVAIIAAELATRRIAEDIEPTQIIATGSSREPGEDSKLYPKALGGYHKMKQIARGAMGVIFKAARRSDGGVVALKVLPLQGTVNKEDIERFKREIETITSLVHPNIVRVFDFGQEEDFYFYAMEYIDGVSLRNLIQDRGHLSLYHGIEIVRDAARGVAYAHQHGVIHRDIKPSNVMIDARGQVKIVDFGLAFHKSSQILTRTGISLGTPAFMSPEQIEGGRQRITERSDIYSLGVTLYETLTGRRPFEGDNQYDVMRRVLFDEPAPAHEANPVVPENVSRVISKSMAKNPAERYSKAAEFIAELDRCLE
jgi:eukaryotic-like serine/threonine-protein kinase